jgi:hypothetical protein
MEGDITLHSSCSRPLHGRDYFCSNALRDTRRDRQHGAVLCSDLASAITGAQYVVDGARTAIGGAVTQAMQR